MHIPVWSAVIPSGADRNAFSLETTHDRPVRPRSIAPFTPSVGDAVANVIGRVHQAGICGRIEMNRARAGTARCERTPT
jgi:hypothetical protein